MLKYVLQLLQLIDQDYWTYHVTYISERFIGRLPHIETQRQDLPTLEDFQGLGVQSAGGTSKWRNSP